LVSKRTLDGYIEDWEQYLAGDFEPEAADRIRRHSRSGRPLMGGLAS
jgi:hypothetical protein